jgi:hypothetical protein
MRIARALFFGALAYLAVFAACVYAAFGLGSLWICHRWSGCLEVPNGAASYLGLFLIIGAPVSSLALIASVIVAILVIARVDREADP